MTLRCKDIGIKKSEFVTKIQFLLMFAVKLLQFYFYFLFESCFFFLNAKNRVGTVSLLTPVTSWIISSKSHFHQLYLIVNLNTRIALFSLNILFTGLESEQWYVYRICFNLHILYWNTCVYFMITHNKWDFRDDCTEFM